MSKATKKRYVTKQLQMELVLPAENEVIAQVTASRGNNLLEVEDAVGERYLARNTVWVKRGHFVILEPIEEGDKVRAEISQVLDTENILYIRKEKLWPERFEAEAEAMTRGSKRGGVDENVIIDPDMLPPSETESEGEDEEEESGDDCSDDDVSDDLKESKPEEEKKT